MTRDMEKGRPGQTFDDFLKEQDSYEATRARAVKRVLGFQLAEAMKRQGITKLEMARRLQTRQSQLDRLLDPDYEDVTLALLARAARVLGRDLRLELI